MTPAKWRITVQTGPFGYSKWAGETPKNSAIEMEAPKVAGSEKSHQPKEMNMHSAVADAKSRNRPARVAGHVDLETVLSEVLALMKFTRRGFDQRIEAVSRPAE